MTYSHDRDAHASNRARNVTAVLGPTNTGKTHLALERMLGHSSGMIGLPLRLLAREIYDRIVKRIGPGDVALITGEERIKPKSPRYYVCTVEAMPRDLDVDFLAIDEIQLAGDPERGHVFTDRLLHLRGNEETLFLGASTMRDCITDILPGCNFISRPRLSKLTYAGQKKITRLPPRSAIVAFSANDVYEVAELIRRQRGGAAVVLGALSPRTRNAQVALYQNGDVDFLVATDAIGMGLNLDVDHVAFAGARKFDGQNHRDLTAAELGQIAGRAGRHLNDGTFGVTSNVEPFDSELINQLENHEFESVKKLQWRNRHLEFDNLDILLKSLKEHPKHNRLTRARVADDVSTLEAAVRDKSVADRCGSIARVKLLWDVCQVPDYRKISTTAHADLVVTLFKFLTEGTELISEDWYAKQVALADRTDGDIDTLANRIAHVRTWTFVSNRTDWLADAVHWQEKTREIEDNLSDALHERLTQRFVDERTSVLMKRLRDDEALSAEIGEDGAINIENHFVGRIIGFRYLSDADNKGLQGKAARNAAAQVLSKEFSTRARRVSAAQSDAFSLNSEGFILWKGEEIGQIAAGEQLLKPVVTVLADDQLSGIDREKVQDRLDSWLDEEVRARLAPLHALTTTEDLTGLAKGFAYRLTENFGILKREDVADDVRALDQDARAQLRKFGLRFGAFNIYFPVLLKPAASQLLALLWGLKGVTAGARFSEIPTPPRSGLTSVKRDKSIDETFYRAVGFHLCGERAVRIDMLERLADMIRPLVSWRNKGDASGDTLQGATGDGGFRVIPDMMSIMGCSAEELGHILRALGFRMERRRLESAPETGETTETSETSKSETAGDASEESGEDKVAEVDPVDEVAAQKSASKGGDEGDRPVADEKLAKVAADDIQEDGDKPSDAELYEEIWRPRRKKSHDGHAPALRHKSKGKSTQKRSKGDDRAASAKGGKHKKGRRDEKSAAPAQKARTMKKKRKERVPDPDSPFAALSKLKQELEDQAQNQA